MFRALSCLCGVALGSTVAVKCLERFDRRNRLNAENASLTRSDGELIQVQVLFRHGARTPLKLIPGLEETVWNKNELRYDLEHTKLEYEIRNMTSGHLFEKPSFTGNELKGGCRMGELTIVGQQETFDLGIELKKRYIDELNLVDGIFDDEIVFLRTTYVQRTIESLRCVVSGMFNMKNDPVVFWTLPIADEIFIPNWTFCKALRQYVKYCFANTHRLPGYQEDLQIFSKIVGKPLKNVNFIDIYDDLSCRNAHNKSYPSEVKNFMRNIEKRVLQQLSHSLSSPDWTRGMILPLSCGQMLQHLYKNMLSKIKRKNNYKLYLHSAHDITLFSLCSALDITLERWPQFASYISLELYENKTGEHFVRVIYCGEVVKFKRFNKDMISLNQFKEIITPLFVDDIKTACQTVFQTPEQPSFN